MGPKVSAVVTSFNQSEFIEEALQSLKDQVYRGELEIIVVDDGSTDETRKLLKAETDPRIQIIHKSNGGPSSALNEGCRRATGEIVLFLAADDVAHEDRVAAHVDILRSGGSCGISASHPQLIDNQGYDLPDHLVPDFYRFRGRIEADQVIEELLFGRNFICAATVAIHRRVTDKIGPFNAGLFQTQDYEYWIRAAAAGFAFNISTERFSRYRLHSTSLSHHTKRAGAAAELNYVVRRAFDHLPDETLRRVYAARFAPPPLDVDRRFIQPIAYLTHPNPSLRQVGIERLLELFENEADEERLRVLLGVTPAYLHRFLAESTGGAL